LISVFDSLKRTDSRSFVQESIPFTSHTAFYNTHRFKEASQKMHESTLKFKVNQTALVVLQAFALVVLQAV